MPRRAWVLLKSGRWINLLEPMATYWEDEDLALGEIWPLDCRGLTEGEAIPLGIFHCRLHSTA